MMHIYISKKTRKKVENAIHCVNEDKPIMVHTHENKYTRVRGCT